MYAPSASPIMEVKKFHHEKEPLVTKVKFDLVGWTPESIDEYLMNMNLTHLKYLELQSKDGWAIYALDRRQQQKYGYSRTFTLNIVIDKEYYSKDSLINDLDNKITKIYFPKDMYEEDCIQWIRYYLPKYRYETNHVLGYYVFEKVSKSAAAQIPGLLYKNLYVEYNFAF